MFRVFVTLPTAGTFYSYLKRLSDGFFWDDSDSTFKVFSGLIDGKIDFVEDVNVPGEYSWSRSVPDGEYVVYTKESPTNENAAQAFQVIIKFGNEVVDAKIIDTGSELIDIVIEEC